LSLPSLNPDETVTTAIIPQLAILGSCRVVKRKKKKSSCNPSGQHDHKASRLEKNEAPDGIAVHEVDACQQCIEDL